MRKCCCKQDAAIYARRSSAGATLDEAVDPGNKEFGPLAHPEQVQMRVAKRAMMLEAGIAAVPGALWTSPPPSRRFAPSMTASSRPAMRPKTVVGIAGRVLFLRNAGGLCFVQLSAGDGTKIQGMISKKEIGADSLKQFKQLVDLGRSPVPQGPRDRLQDRRAVRVRHRVGYRRQGPAAAAGPAQGS